MVSFVSYGLQEAVNTASGAALGYAGIFSISANLRLESTFSATGVSTKVNLGSVFSQKYICNPK